MEKNDITPLQLYKKAYNCHYEENNIKEARNLYRELINNYPGSDIADYAQIQLYKITKVQEEKVQCAANGGYSKLNKTIAIVTIISLCLSIGIIIYLVYTTSSLKTDMEIIYKLSQVYPKLYTGNEADAFRILNEIKALNKKDITPYSVAADIYSKSKNFTKARYEFESFSKIYPESATEVKEYIFLINSAEKSYLDSLKELAILKNIVKKERIDNIDENDENSSINRKKNSGSEREPEIIDQSAVSYF